MTSWRICSDAQPAAPAIVASLSEEKLVALTARVSIAPVWFERLLNEHLFAGAAGPRSLCYKSR